MKNILLLLLVITSPFGFSQQTATTPMSPILKNFYRINQIKDWTEIKAIPLDGQSAEGGEVKFYYNGTVLEKFITYHYGEMGKVLTEYYLLDTQLSFVFEVTTNYNRPIYWTKEMAEENGDSEGFDPEKSTVLKNRFYFDGDELIKQILETECEGTEEECQEKNEKSKFLDFINYWEYTRL